MILAYAIDGRSLTRKEGLVRLIVPSETDDALRQVKWVAQICVVPKHQYLDCYNPTIDLQRRCSSILLVAAIVFALLSLLRFWFMIAG